MAGTTTNFAIPYPSSSDYVTDGATAMRSIADQVDAVLFTGSSSGNLLINGAMQVSQRSAVGTAVTGITGTGYNIADRWGLNCSSLGTWSLTTIADAPTGSGFVNSFKMDCTTADASPAAGDFCFVSQKIEAQNLQSLRKGTASAQTMTLSFWVKSFQTGTYVVEFYDAVNTRSFSKAYTVTTSNIWQYVSMLVPADTTGTMTNSNVSGIEINFWLGAGSTYTSGTLPTAWGAVTNANRAAGQTNVASATTGEWQMTGAQLTVGSVATPFEFKSFADDLRDCQRYFFRWQSAVNGDIYHGVYQPASTGIFATFPFPVYMRTDPTSYTVSGFTVINSSATPAAYYASKNWFIINSSVNAGIGNTNQSGFLSSSSNPTIITASAEL
jgi:hypothetical protein